MIDSMSGASPVCVDLGNAFTAHARFDDPLHVVEMSGDLDGASRAAAIHACSSVDRLDVLVDLSGLAFMDCAGYGALVTASTTLTGRGGSLVLMNPVGEPRRLLSLIEECELGLCAALRYGAPHIAQPAE